MEEWKEIKDFEGYSVSNLGNVRRGNKSVNKCCLKTGQLYVKLCLNGKPYNRMIHKLVAEEFVPNPQGYAEVAHKDGDLKNNVADNLIWCNKTDKYDYDVNNQANYVFRVIQKDKNENIIGKFKNYKEAAKFIGGNPDIISKACKRLIDTAYGYKWEHLKYDYKPENKKQKSPICNVSTKIDALYLAIDIINKLPNLCDWSLYDFMTLTKEIEGYLKD